MISLDWTALFVLLSFVVFMILMKAVFFDPIRNIKAAREAQILNDQNKAQEVLHEHESLHLNYEVQLKEARQKAQQLITDLRDQAKGDASGKISKAREEARLHLEAKLAEIATSREETYQALDDERTSLAETILKRVLKINTSPVVRKKTASYQ